MLSRALSLEPFIFNSHVNVLFNNAIPLALLVSFIYVEGNCFKFSFTDVTVHFLEQTAKLCHTTDLCIMQVRLSGEGYSIGSLWVPSSQMAPLRMFSLL